MNEVKVVCGIIYNDQKIFIARRKKGKSQAGLWEFPGGKVEIDESHKSALKRELSEEFGMEVEVRKYVDSHIHKYSHITIELIAYECQFIEASFRLTDHDAVEWVSPSCLQAYSFTAADIPFVHQLLK